MRRTITAEWVVYSLNLVDLSEEQIFDELQALLVVVGIWDPFRNRDVVY